MEELKPIMITLLEKQKLESAARVLEAIRFDEKDIDRVHMLLDAINALRHIATTSEVH